MSRRGSEDVPPPPYSLYNIVDKRGSEDVPPPPYSLYNIIDQSIYFTMCFVMCVLFNFIGFLFLMPIFKNNVAATSGGFVGCFISSFLWGVLTFYLVVVVNASNIYIFFILLFIQSACIFFSIFCFLRITFL